MVSNGVCVSECPTGTIAHGGNCVSTCPTGYSVYSWNLPSPAISICIGSCGTDGWVSNGVCQTCGVPNCKTCSGPNICNICM